MASVACQKVEIQQIRLVMAACLGEIRNTAPSTNLLWGKLALFADKLGGETRRHIRRDLLI